MDTSFFVEKLYKILYEWEKYKECLKEEKQGSL